MSTGPGIFTKAIAVGGAALGGILFCDRLKHARNELGRIDHANVAEDYMHHAMEEFYDYSGNDTLNGIKHKLFNPIRLHCITRPLTYIKGFASMIKDNLVPLGLMFLGLTYAFNGSPLSIIAKTGNILGKGCTGMFIGLKAVGGAACKVIGSGLYSLWSKSPSIASSGPKGILAGAAAIGIGLYALHRFKRELTGENQNEFFHGLKSGDHH